MAQSLLTIALLMIGFGLLMCLCGLGIWIKRSRSNDHFDTGGVGAVGGGGADWHKASGVLPVSGLERYSPGDPIGVPFND